VPTPSAFQPVGASRGVVTAATISETVRRAEAARQTAHTEVGNPAMARECAPSRWSPQFGGALNYYMFSHAHIIVICATRQRLMLFGVKRKKLTP